MCGVIIITLSDTKILQKTCFSGPWWAHVLPDISNQEMYFMGSIWMDYLK